jgi:hypothetical protein
VKTPDHRTAIAGGAERAAAAAAIAALEEFLAVCYSLAARKTVGLTGTEQKIVKVMVDGL